MFNSKENMKEASSPKKRIVGIYKITSPTGRVYIGQSTHIVNRRWKYSAGRCRNQPFIYNSIQKHGWDAHSFEVIIQCNKEELNELEIKYIALFDSTNPEKGLNVLPGGKGATGRKLSNEAKEKIGAAHRGKIVGSKTREKLSIAGKGRPSWSKGKKLSADHIKKVSEKLKGRKSPCGMLGKKWSPETRAKFLLSTVGVSKNKGKIAYQYPVIQFDLYDVLIKEWDSAKQAARELSLNQGNIVSCLKNNRNKTGGFKWKYKK
jgi:group I intron endonuclease